MEKKDFIIGIDMDDTIEDLCEAWIAWLNNKYECHVNPKDILTLFYYITFYRTCQYYLTEKILL